MCDEQLMSIGGEIALSGNKHAHTKKNTRILQLVLGPCNSCVLEPVLDRFIHFNCFNRKLDFLGFLDSFEFLVQCFCARSSFVQSLHRILQFLIFQRLSSTCLQHSILMLLSQLVSVLLLHVLAAIASSSACDECSCQFLFEKQLLLHSKNLCTTRAVVPGSSLRTSSANRILSILPS